MYYFYTSWYFEGDDVQPEGMYHTTYESSQSRVEFFSDFIFPKEFFFKEFDSKEEMMKYWEEKHPLG